ncbi:MAG: hypothetical protein J7559_20435 [Cohnella sp.]|nr:hypothetical protein [Cohnella sp.]
MSDNAPIASKDSAYGKAQLLSAKRFTPQQKDMLSALLEEDKTYTVKQAEQLIRTFIQRKVS